MTDIQAWLAKREARAGWRGFQCGHEQGYWEAKDERTRR